MRRIERVLNSYAVCALGFSVFELAIRILNIETFELGIDDLSYMYWEEERDCMNWMCR